VAVERVLVRLRVVYRMLAQRNRRLGEPFGAGELEQFAQEVTLAVWSKLSQFKGLSPLEGWIYRFAQLELMYRLRRRDGAPRSIEEVRGARELVGQEALGSGLEDAEVLYPALDELEPAQLEVIRLKHFEDLTFPEIADRLGGSPNTAKTRYYRGLRRLREILGRGERVREGSR
jgi:RNA polymerase sigma-70 factor (ECF subfamily)